MSYDQQDADRDSFIETIQHEFTADRLRSYYEANPGVMEPALDAMTESQELLKNGHHAAAIVFACTAMEQLFKVAILRPLIYGLVHHDSLAAEITNRIVSPQLRTDQYMQLLSRICEGILGSTAKELQDKAGRSDLLQQCKNTINKRNDIVHGADKASHNEARQAIDQIEGVYQVFVIPVMLRLGLEIDDLGRIKTHAPSRCD